MLSTLPVGKLPPALLARLLSQAPGQDPNVILGPGLGLDCAVVEVGDRLLVLTSDPITFAAEDIGWYAVQINANDLATTGARPRWFLCTLLLPEGRTTPEIVTQITHNLYSACRNLDVTVIGGHTEITHGLDRPILAGTMIGEVAREALVTPQGAQPGDSLLLTKGVPIEATAILAREFAGRLVDTLSPAELAQAQHYLYNPGLSIVRDAQLAVRAGRVTAMHDPTEGGIAAALWELAQASQCTLVVNPEAIPIPALAGRVCRAFGLDPLAAIASGALLLTCPAVAAGNIKQSLEQAGITCRDIGWVEPGPPEVWSQTPTERSLLAYPDRDEIARLFDEA